MDPQETAPLPTDLPSAYLVISAQASHIASLQQEINDQKGVVCTLEKMLERQMEFNQRLVEEKKEMVESRKSWKENREREVREMTAKAMEREIEGVFDRNNKEIKKVKQVDAL
jgi:predicted Holliday junction resolvase-like endonuclease